MLRFKTILTRQRIRCGPKSEQTPGKHQERLENKRWWKTCGLHPRDEKRNPGWGKPSQAGGQRVKQEGSGGDGRAAGARWILLPGEGNFSVMHRKAYFRTKCRYDLAMGTTP